MDVWTDRQEEYIELYFLMIWMAWWRIQRQKILVAFSFINFIKYVLVTYCCCVAGVLVHHCYETWYVSV